MSDFGSRAITNRPYRIRSIMKRHTRIALLLALCVLFAACAPEALPAAAIADNSLPTLQPLAPLRSSAEDFLSPAAPSFSPKPPAAPSSGILGSPIASPAPSPTPMPEPFTIAWMSDTQYYSRSFPQIFLIMTRWLVENREKENIVYMGFTGDIVHNDTEKQWKNADDAFRLLDGVLPYGVLAGNHDVGTSKEDYSSYGERFGEARFSDKPFYGGSYENNRGHYDLIEAGGMELIFVYMGWGVDDAGIDWINGVLQGYPDRLAVLMLHEYLSTSGDQTEVGQTLFERIVSPNKNVRFVLCGHNHGVTRRTDAVDDTGDGTPDRIVYQILADYQAEPKGGNGFLRLLRFVPALGRVYVSTYSPYLEKDECFEGEDSFILSFN